jgi:molecular chaperone HscA
MGLLQIGASAKSRCLQRVAGIDLGTTFSLVARVREGTPQVLPDGEGTAALASIVYYGADGKIQVGAAARKYAFTQPERTIASVKRFMGRSQSEAVRLEDVSSYRFSGGPEDSVVHFQVDPARKVTPIEVSSEILKSLKTRAEKALGGPLEGVVITVPAYFDDAQRQATKDAAHIAGLSVLRLLNEPTAAALAYGLDRRPDGVFAVFDLGGGTFDASILRLDGGTFQVLATGGDSRLGGDDFDRDLAQHFLRAVGLESGQLKEAQVAELLESARSSKEELTGKPEVTMSALGHRITVTRDQLNQVVQATLARTSGPVRRVLRDCEIDAAELDGVLLVGGATRMPAVVDHVRSIFKQEPLRDLDPDQVVALGAAVQADLLSGNASRKDILLIDVLPLSLGLETMGGGVERLLNRNQAIPVGAEQTFTTYADAQTGMKLHVVQGEREMAGDCRSLARFDLSGIPPMPAGLPKVRVRFEVDADGILHVSAIEERSGQRASIEVKPSYGLDEGAVRKMVDDSYVHAEADLEARFLADARIEGKRLLPLLDDAIQSDSDLLSEEEVRVLNGEMSSLKHLLEAGTHSEIRKQIDVINARTAQFAVKRMNRSLGAELSGREAQSVAEGP